MTSDLRAQLQAALGAAYTIERELGGGGMSRVFVATQTTLHRRVVVKVLPPDFAAELSVERFRREIQLAAQLQNPHIVPLHAASEGGGLLYYTMPYVEGESLRARLERDGELPIGVAVQVVRDVAKALAYAHRRGIVHRDIKPENILLSEGDALVADFGVAKALSASTTSDGGGLTSVGMALGTPAYMAPEQAAGDTGVDARADLYALGAVAYEMLAGSALFPGRSPQALIAAHTTETPEPIERRRPNVPASLASLVMRLLAKRPAERPQSADDVLRELETIVSTSGSGLTPAVAASARRRRVAGAAVILVAAATIAVARSRRAVHPSAPATAVAEASVAVLPFVNMSGDRENQYFSDGMTEELIDRLANIRGLRVAARTSAFAVKRDLDAPEIGRQLHVRNLVEGSVRRSGSRIRVTAQLINADSGYHRWSHTYDADVKDVFSVQQQIATAIVGELRLVLAGSDSAMLARAPTGDTAAHRLYLQGRYYWNKRTGESLERAAELFTQAIARDSSYAEAYSGLAVTYLTMPWFVDVPTDSLLAISIAAANHSLRLDSSRAEAYNALGAAHASLFEWTEAVRAQDRAIAVQPNDATAHEWKGYVLMGLERYPGAIHELRIAKDLDPLALSVRSDLAYALLTSGDATAAESESRAAIGLDATFPNAWQILGLTLLAQGRADSAVAVLRHEVSLEKPEPYAGSLAFLARAFVLAGHTDSAVAIERRLETRAKNHYVSPAALGIIALSLGHRDRAFELFGRAVDVRDGVIDNYFPMDHSFDAIRGDPRYADLKRRMNLQ